MTDSKQKNLLLVEDDEFMQQSVSDYLTSEGFQVYLANHAANALAVADEYSLDGVVVDLVIPLDATSGRSLRHAKHGLQLVRQLKGKAPTLGVVVFSAHEEHGKEILELVNEGMRGIAYILKGQPADDLLQAIHSALAGEIHFGPEVRINTWTPATAFWQLCTLPEERIWIKGGLVHFDALTSREREIANLLASSHTTPAVARILSIDLKTAETHLRNMYAKLGLDEIDNQAPHLNARSIFVKICSLYELQHKHVEQP